MARDGLLTYKPRHGFFVTSFDREDVNALYDYRAALESMAIKLAIDDLEENEPLPGWFE